MNKLSLQFHATIKDIYAFVNDILRCGTYYVCGVSLNPKFKLEDISTESGISDFKRYEMIVVSKDSIVHCDDYKGFVCNQENNLGITVGYNDNDILKESTMWISSQNEIDDEWKGIINKYKRSLLKGAWVVNPNTNVRTYYKNHRYTTSAKEAYEKGVKICPIAGWNIYELTNEQNR